MLDWTAALDQPPALDASLAPPLIHGPAVLTAAGLAGTPPPPDEGDDPGTLFDRGLAHQLRFERSAGLALQARAIAASPLLRVRRPPPGPDTLRLLAVCAPGDLMANTPIDFITTHLDVRLDLLFVPPAGPLPRLPEHDVALFAAAETDQATMRRLHWLWMAWPRPVLNNPALLPALRRDALSRGLAERPGMLSPRLREVTRAELGAGAFDTVLPGAGRLLIRPCGSHAGAGLVKVSTEAELAAAVAAATAETFYVSEFIDYRDRAGAYRKYRIAFVDGRPLLCHMAVSDHWMVHYLNAGMSESAGKRDAEAREMATFDSGFARRHAAAFGALLELLPLDYFVIDCAESADGRLLVFEADTAAIIHAMDPPALFAYKSAQMQRVFAAFEALLRRRARQPR